MPCSYARASIIIAKTLNTTNENSLNSLKEALNEVYFTEFNNSLQKKKVKFALYDKLYIQDCTDLKTRLVDEVEIVFLAKKSNVKIDKIIGDYNGEDKTVTILNKAMKRVRKNSVEDFKDEKSLVVTKALKYAKNNIAELNNIKKV